MKKLFSLLTLALLTLSVGAANTYVKVTSADQLVAGKKYILVNEDNNAALGAISNTSTPYGTKVDVAISNGVVDIDGTAAVELTLGSNNSSWTFDMGNDSEHHYLVWTSGNSLNTATELSTANTNWTASTTDDGIVLINGADNTRKLQYNQSSPRFACYTSAQKPAVLYVQQAAVTVAAPTLTPAQSFDESITVTITNNEEGATLYYSTDGLAWTLYTEALTITETTTVYAKATKGGVDSPVVSAKYTKNEPVPEGAIVFTPGNFDAIESSAWTITKDGVTISCTSGTITADQFRMFKSQTTTISSTVGAITKIEFTCTANGTTKYGPGCFQAQDGYTYETDGPIGTWTGSTSSVSFYTETNQVRATQILVFVNSEVPAVSAPVFDPAGCTFTGSQVVALTCETEGAAIYYSINDGEYQLYNAPFTLTATSTVKAYAELNGTQSATITATYTKRVEVSSVADANALGNKVDFIYYGDVAVSYQWYNANNQYYSTWIVDGQGNAGLIYGKQVPALNQGDVLAEEWEAQKTTYNGIPEFQYPNNVVASGDTWEINPVELTTVTTDDVNKYIIMKGQTITADATDTTGRRYINADSLVIFNQFGVELPAFEEGKTYDVVAIATIYHNAPELYIISATEVQAAAGLRGDVDGSENVNIADVTALIDYLLSGNAEGVVVGNADCNVDQAVNIADVTALIDFLLSGNWSE